MTFIKMTAAELQKNVAKLRVFSNRVIQWTLWVHCPWWKMTPYFVKTWSELSQVFVDSFILVYFLQLYLSPNIYSYFF